MLASDTLHRLVVFSLFLADIELYNRDSKSGHTYSISTMAPSSIVGPRIQLLVRLLATPYFAGDGAGRWTPGGSCPDWLVEIESGKPFVGSSSLAMSTACHLGTEEVDEDVVE
jgi:hypothetical protein